MGALEQARASWPEFVWRAEQDGLPLYLAHERAFDPEGIHGRLHACRALLWAEAMARYLERSQAPGLAFPALRWAALLHDAGRQSNGADLWEADSAQLIVEALRRAGHPEMAEPGGALVVKKRAAEGRWALHQQIVTDADVLEIMRPFCLGGRRGFRTSRFSFLREPGNPAADSLRDRVIDEALELIILTRQARLPEGCAGYLSALLELVERRRERLPFLAEQLG